MEKFCNPATTPGDDDDDIASMFANIRHYPRASHRNHMLLELVCGFSVKFACQPQPPPSYTRTQRWTQPNDRALEPGKSSVTLHATQQLAAAPQLLTSSEHSANNCLQALHIQLAAVDKHGVLIKYSESPHCCLTWISDNHQKWPKNRFLHCAHI